ncbi:hypothetical protein [Micromonospora zhanjiangensis]|uniref:Integral membrane protein n=1 Tax=Micromonospora zhanjiangensis TaxID=1522057 RepID=A0ABV8KE87_9ACTN
MLGVLLADARPGQRRPTVGEAADLVLSGLGTRLAAGLRGFRDRSWAEAAATVGLLGASLLLLHRLLRLTGPLIAGAYWPPPNGPAGPSVQLGLSVLTCLAVVIAAATGLRRTAAVLGWAVAIAQALTVVTYLPANPMAPSYAVWPVALGLVTAAALSVPAAGVVATRIIGGRGLVLFGVAAVAVLAAGVFRDATIVGTAFSWPGGLALYGRVFFVPDLLLYLVAGLCALLAVARVPGPVRRRMALILLPVPVAVLAADSWGAGFLDAQLGDVSYVSADRWVTMAMAPVLTFLIGVALLRRRERTLRLLALGRRADHPDWTAGRPDEGTDRGR